MLTQEEKSANRFKQQLDFAKTKQIGTYLNLVAKSLQGAIRAEAGRYVGPRRAIRHGEKLVVDSTLGEVVCVTCAAVLPWSAKGTHGGHLLPGRRANTVLIEEQIWPQCYCCNEVKKGNVAQYELFMAWVYSREFIEQLHVMDRVTKNWTFHDLVDLRLGYMDRIKVAEKAMQ